jgi:hypothetical protein
MKINLKLANGAILDFEGDEAEFQRLSEFLAQPPESLTAGSASPSSAPDDSSQQKSPEIPRAPLAPAAVASRLEKVGAANDQERVTVIAQMAQESGLEGVDFETLAQLYSELGFRKPAQFPSKTLSNAKSSGLVTPVKPGVWRPTYRGENFAKGFGRDTQPRRRPTSSPREPGGDSD